MSRPQFTQPVERPLDRTRRNVWERTDEGTATVSTGGSDTVETINHTIGGGDDVYVTEAFIVPESSFTANATGTELKFLDSESTVVGKYGGMMPEASRIELQSPVAIPDSGEVQLVVHNYTGGSIDIRTFVTFMVEA